jgi:lipopolysaccharide transport system permease protein
MTLHNYLFLTGCLISRDFKIRYRNMSLGVFWSLLNPLVLMGVLTFVFTRIMNQTEIENFHVFVLCGLVPYNFFSMSWSTATTSLVGNANLIRRVRFPREILPVATVLANAVHFGIQIALLLLIAVLAGYPVTPRWLWLPYIFGFEILFLCGLGLFSAALDVYFRDVRYVVESATLVLFWLVPIFYSFAQIAPHLAWVYSYNPVAAVVLACRQVILDDQMPAYSLLRNLCLVSVAAMAAGGLLFHYMKRRFADYL